MGEEGGGGGGVCSEWVSRPSSGVKYLLSYSAYLPTCIVYMLICERVARPLHSRFFLGFSVPRAAIETRSLELYASLSLLLSPFLF